MYRRFGMDNLNRNVKDLYVLTGFLGAGKTTLLKRLLLESKDKKIGVIQNEFGKINIDGEILRDNDNITITEISNGSIFCSCLQLNFVKSLAELATLDLDVVIVESSGLADPSNVGEILNSVKELVGESYALKGIVCLIDAVNFLDQLSDEATVNRQLEHCHLAVVNKIDLVDETQLAKVIEAVRKVNPVCEILTAVEGDIDFEILNSDLTRFQWKEDEDSLNSVDNKPKTISLVSDEIIPKEKFDAFLKEVLVDTYRIKGFAHLDEGWQQVDVVEKLIDYKDSEAKARTEIVFLSKVSIKVIRTVHDAWEKHVGLSFKLQN